MFVLISLQDVKKIVVVNKSNAIVFANSVLGARTQRYGDFIDICCALTGRAPAAGLHLTEHRRGQVLYTLHDIPEQLLQEDVLFPVLGYLIGATTQNLIPVIQGLLPETSEDQPKRRITRSMMRSNVTMNNDLGENTTVKRSMSRENEALAPNINNIVEFTMVGGTDE